jgi:hypothetical protein
VIFQIDAGVTSYSWSMLHIAARPVSAVAIVLVASLLTPMGCSDSSNDGTGNGTDAGPHGTDGSSSGTDASDTDANSNGADGGTTKTDGGTTSQDAGRDAGPCDQDPLKTNLPPLFNGMSVDVYDCPILKYTAKYSEPDAMIFKAIVYVESRFKNDAIGCTGNGPCCPQSGWTGTECACLGAMQTGPQCGGASTLGLLSNGHVDLETNSSAPDWANSVFNPEVNIELGIAGIAGNRAQVKKQFSGCTEDQYTMMAIGNFNSYGSTKSCTVYNFAYDNAVLDAYKNYSTASGWAAHPY